MSWEGRCPHDQSAGWSAGRRLSGSSAVVAGCRGTADQRCTVIYEELAEGQLRGLEPLVVPAEMASELDGLFVRCVVRGVIVLALCARVLRDVTARALSPAAHTRTLSTARRTRWRRLLDVD